MAQHEEMGQQLADGEALVIELCRVLWASYPKKSRAVRNAERVFWMFKGLKLALEDQLVREHPGAKWQEIYWGRKPRTAIKRRARSRRAASK